MGLISVIGGGSIGLGMAAWFSSRGRTVKLYSRPLPSSLVDHKIVTEGKLEWQGHISASSDIKLVVHEAEVIFLCVPGNAQKSAVDLLAPNLKAGQTVVISAQYSLSALYLSKKISELNITGVSIVALATTMLTGRRMTPHSVRVLSIRGQYGFAAYPSDGAPDIDLLMHSLSGKSLSRITMADIAFGNANPIAHVPNAMCNLTRIEKGEEWSNYEMMTKTVCALIEKLDAERCEAGRSFGVDPITFNVHLHRSFGTPLGTIYEMCTHIRGTRSGLRGPDSLASRYITEDVPFGLVPVAALGALSGAPTTTHSAFISLLSTACETEFEDENDLLSALSLSELSFSELQQKLEQGWQQ